MFRDLNLSESNWLSRIALASSWGMFQTDVSVESEALAGASAGAVGSRVYR